MKCDNCKKHDDCAAGSGLTWPCGAYVPVAVSNADRIRAMSDERLAAFMLEPFCDKRTHDECTISYCGICSQCILDWLQEPAEGEMKPGDKVTMNDNYHVSEADKGKVWIVKSEPWNCCGTMVVKLEGKSGGYAVDGLSLVEEMRHENSDIL